MTEQSSFFEDERAVPDPSLGREDFPEDFVNTYRPSVNRVVIEYTDTEREALQRMLGLSEIKKTVYHFGELKR